ncbi:glycosyltransferase family 2 protein [Enterococcus xiangfangensis]|uniref:Glycosyltransferase family 2 protein n=1 Tax=Enterococcus xiangfangensis TaxID=1296537 RepID=A0ABU3F6R8_9ENTE|nr:glycosyltransferase family 2 protein [Enterococcus xiangfangensis]MDT2758356.1 glycosyltransferase family 2 protein [Enterococcus xiangfangensis]
MDKRSKTRISVCMATYNGRHFIEEQLNSIFPQLSEYDELIISDDHSTDGTWEFLLELKAKEPRIKLFQNKGRGVIANFTNAIQQSTHSIIFLSDQDDVWQPDKVEKMLPYFENPQTQVVVSDLVIVDNEFKVLAPSYQAMRRTRAGFWHNLVKSSYIGAGMAFRSEFKAIILPIPPTVPMHDMWIGLLADYYHGVVFIPDPLVYYRRHGLNASEIKTTASRIQQFKWRWNALCLVRERIKEVKKK